MGWNSWNCFGHEVSAEKVKQAARAMVESGLVNYGWTYINIDDSWQHHRDPNDRTRGGRLRDDQGNIIPNAQFPDMKGLTDYIHSLGLKVGIYSSPGPWTCGGCVGSYGYEKQDADMYGEWGLDYLKYDSPGTLFITCVSMVWEMSGNGEMPLAASAGARLTISPILGKV